MRLCFYDWEETKEKIEIEKDLCFEINRFSPTIRRIEADNMFLTEFVKIYSKPYLLDNGKDKRFPNLNQSKKAVEDVFFDDRSGIINQEKWDYLDILKILAWKMGKINHKESTQDEFMYASGWNEAKLKIQMPKGNFVDQATFKAFSEKVFEAKRLFNDNKDINTVWKKLLEAGNLIEGMGTVYLVTLLFFISKGEFPIYDRFAMASLLSFYFCENNIEAMPSSSHIRVRNLPQKTEKKAEKMIEDQNSEYNKYIKLLSRYFEADGVNGWKNNRCIDRALWVYGHHFKVEE